MNETEARLVRLAPATFRLESLTADMIKLRLERRSVPSMKTLKVATAPVCLMRVFFAIALAATSVSIAADWPQLTPKDQRELEKFYGAEYIHTTVAGHERLLRAAIKAQETGICNIHHIQMQKKRVPIYFGLPVFEDPYYSAALAYFPNAREYVNGGCEVDPVEDKQPHFRYVCAKCKQAQRQWAVAHPKSEWAKDILAKRPGLTNR